MKRAGNLMPLIAAPENLREAFLLAVRGKQLKPECIRFRQDMDGEIARLHHQLLDGSYRMGDYRRFKVFDPKERTICAVPFRDRVVMHAMMRVCHNLYENLRQDFLPKRHKKVPFWEKIIIILAMMTLSFTNARAQEHAGMQKVGILVAMEKEYNLLTDIAKDGQVKIMQCGIGKVNAAVACVEMIRGWRPDVVVAIGCAGGHGEGVHVGDVVVSTATAYHDVYCGDDVVYGQVQGMPERYATPQWMVDAALKLEGRVRAGLVVTGDWFVDSKEKMRAIASHFPDAMAIDMESAAIAQVCHRYGVPFVSLRIVSDMPLADEHGSQYAGFWKTVSDKTFSIARDFVKQITNKE